MLPARLAAHPCAPGRRDPLGRETFDDQRLYSVQRAGRIAPDARAGLGERSTIVSIVLGGKRSWACFIINRRPELRHRSEHRQHGDTFLADFDAGAGDDL